MTPSRKIDQLIAGLAGWRGETFAQLRKTILQADPDIVEDWKWMGSPVWEKSGIIAVANAHKGKVKLTFDKGAHIPDPKNLFNAGLDGNQRRAIDFLEGDKIDAPGLKALVRAAIAYNQTQEKKRAKKKYPARSKPGQSKKP
ncbi:MAG TPA: DUF1801 domain-containing protein [Rhizomicrobium sp.]|nr:DUF1801 domain-containing protein [Rhizomicrobium sp.]